MSQHNHESSVEGPEYPVCDGCGKRHPVDKNEVLVVLRKTLEKKHGVDLASLPDKVLADIIDTTTGLTNSIWEERVGKVAMDRIESWKADDFEKVKGLIKTITSSLKKNEAGELDDDAFARSLGLHMNITITYDCGIMMGISPEQTVQDIKDRAALVLGEKPTTTKPKPRPNQTELN